MNDIIVSLVFSIPFNLTVSALCILTYLFNYFMFKLKKEYKGFQSKSFLILLLPLLNIVFLVFNLMIGYTYGAGYRIVKPRKRKYVAKTGSTVKAS